MSARTLTQTELLAEAKERFGDDVLNIAFQCPVCGDVAKIGDFKHEDRGRAGQECIGRSLGALLVRPPAKWEGRGCDWAAYGLFSGPWTVVFPDGHEVSSFPLADAVKAGAA